MRDSKPVYGNPYKTSAPVELTYYAKRKRRRWQYSLKGLLAAMLAAALSVGLLMRTMPWLDGLPIEDVWVVFLASAAALVALAALLAFLLWRRRDATKRIYPG